jgi:hypothetical protein
MILPVLTNASVNTLLSPMARCLYLCPHAFSYKMILYSIVMLLFRFTFFSLRRVNLFKGVERAKWKPDKREIEENRK